MRACNGWSALRQFLRWSACLAMAVGAKALYGLGVGWGDGNTVPFLLLGGEDEHAFHVPGHGHEVPLTTDLIQSAQHELPETHDRFHDAKHRLWNLLA